MRFSKLGVLTAVASVAAMAMPSFAAIGDQTLLKIDHIDNSGDFNTFTAANGDLAAHHSGMSGTDRVWWVVPNTVDGAPQLYKINWYNADTTHSNWQPIEVQFNGVAGDASMDPNIPWVGQYGTNHQYLGPNGNGTAGWNTSGPGPQAPGDGADSPTIAEPNPAQADGTSVWLKPGSEIFVKWDFGWSIDNTVSDLMITQVTPEPASLSLLALGAGGLLMRRRRMA